MRLLLTWHGYLEWYNWGGSIICFSRMWGSCQSLPGIYVLIKTLRRKAAVTLDFSDDQHVGLHSLNNGTVCQSDYAHCINDCAPQLLSRPTEPQSSNFINIESELGNRTLYVYSARPPQKNHPRGRLQATYNDPYWPFCCVLNSS